MKLNPIAFILGVVLFVIGFGTVYIITSTYKTEGATKESGAVGVVEPTFHILGSGAVDQCHQISFVNKSNGPWDLRDFKEFLAVQDHNRCKAIKGHPCVSVFIKFPLTDDGMRRYHVSCGPKSVLLE